MNKNAKLLNLKETSNEISNTTLIFDYKRNLIYIKYNITDNIKTILERINR